MTNDELTTLEALANAATPGPWVEDGFDCVRAPDFRILYDNSCRDDDNGARNAAFIAAARDAVPALVATVRDRDAEVTRLREIEALTRQWFANGQQADATKLALIRALDGGGA